MTGYSNRPLYTSGYCRHHHHGSVCGSLCWRKREKVWCGGGTLTSIPLLPASKAPSVLSFPSNQLSQRNPTLSCLPAPKRCSLLHPLTAQSSWAPAPSPCGGAAALPHPELLPASIRHRLLVPMSWPRRQPEPLSPAFPAPLSTSPLWSQRGQHAHSSFWSLVCCYRVKKV